MEYRTLQIRKSLDQSIKICEEIALDPNQEAKDRMESGGRMVEGQIEFLKLLKEGPAFIGKTEIEGNC